MLGHQKPINMQNNKIMIFNTWWSILCILSVSEASVLTHHQVLGLLYMTRMLLQASPAAVFASCLFWKLPPVRFLFILYAEHSIGFRLGDRLLKNYFQFWAKKRLWLPWQNAWSTFLLHYDALPSKLDEFGRYELINKTNVISAHFSIASAAATSSNIIISWKCCSLNCSQTIPSPKLYLHLSLFPFKLSWTLSLGSPSTLGSKPLPESSVLQLKRAETGWWFALCRETSEVQQHMVAARLLVVDLEHGWGLFCWALRFRAQLSFVDLYIRYQPILLLERTLQFLWVTTEGSKDWVINLWYHVFTKQVIHFEWHLQTHTFKH